MKERKKVMVFGTFDKLHPGHRNFFKQAKTLADFLIVIVARDSSVKRIKGRMPVNSEETRLLKIKNEPLVNYARLGHLKDPYRVILEEKPDIICLGYDQNSYVKGLSNFLEKNNLKIKIVRLKPFQPEKFKSSLLT